MWCMFRDLRGCSFAACAGCNLEDRPGCAFHQVPNPPGMNPSAILGLAICQHCIEDPPDDLDEEGEAAIERVEAAAAVENDIEHVEAAATRAEAAFMTEWLNNHIGNAQDGVLIDVNEDVTYALQ